MVADRVSRTVLASIAVIALYFLFMVLISYMLRILICEVAGLFESPKACDSTVLWSIFASSLSASLAFFSVFRLWPNACAKTVTLVFIIGCLCWSILAWVVMIMFGATLVAILYAGFIGLPTGAIVALVAWNVWRDSFIRTIAIVLMTGLIIWSLFFLAFTIKWAMSLAIPYIIFTVLPIMAVAVLIERGKFFPAEIEVSRMSIMKPPDPDNP